MDNHTKNKTAEIDAYIQDQEYIANKYVLRCFTVTMVIYTLIFVLNLLDIFIVNKNIMLMGYIPAVIVYVLMHIMFPKRFLSNKITKYLVILCAVVVSTFIGISVTYHAIIVSVLPVLYAILYSSKRVMRFAMYLTVISTAAIVYGGYFFGLCDANMTLLTTDRLRVHSENGVFLLTEVNPNPFLTLGLYYIVPRCLLFLSVAFVGRSIYNIINGSLEKAKLTAALEEAKAEAERANAAKSQFLARMSHEIRTPMNAVVSMNQMILNESGEEEILKYAQDIKNSSEMLLEIVNEVLDSSQIESGKMKLVESPYEVSKLLNNLYKMIDMKAREKKLELVFDIDPALPSQCLGDEKRIRQVLINLLTNAVKYTEEGTVTLTVSCTTDGESAFLYFSVKDTGIGIREEDIGRLYEEFQRFDMFRNRNVEGTGLGMNIVQEFLKLMGSELQIKSEYEKGSEFSFTLEQKIMNHTPMGDFRETSYSSERETCRMAYIAPNAKVLVVDDSAMNLKVFRTLLKNTRVQITTAQSGEECLEILRQQSFHLVLLDHKMPGMDGVETLKIIKAEKLCENVPIAMLTAHAQIEASRFYLQQGFEDVLTKPILPDALDRLMMRYLPVEPFRPEATVQSAAGEVQPTVEELQQDKVVQAEEAAKSPLEELGKRLPELDVKKGIENCGGEEAFYVEILRDFVELPIKKELARFLKEGNATEYCVRIHGFKNNAYTIGHKNLGDLAYEMEKLSRESLPPRIEQMQEQLVKEYDRICGEMREALGAR